MYKKIIIGATLLISIIIIGVAIYYEKNKKDTKECVNDLDCADKKLCVQNKCIIPQPKHLSCDSDKDCVESNKSHCIIDTHTCVQCIKDGDCTNGTCVQNTCSVPAKKGCETNNDCDPHKFCDKNSGNCVDCLSDENCDGGKCVNNLCTCSDIKPSSEFCTKDELVCINGKWTCPKDCNGNGKLVNGKCICINGYSGDTCNISPSSSCPIHSKNVNGTCICDDGYIGKNCEYSREITCNNNGNPKDDGSCVCDSGFAGKKCEYSKKITCKDHGIPQDDGSCVCDSSFYGDSCQNPKYNTDCSGNGKKDDNGNCVCNNNYVGKNCEYSKDTCNNIVMPDSNGNCDCSSTNYRGNHCEYNIDKYCNSNGKDIVLNKDGSFNSCVCKSGFYGKNCEIDISSFCNGQGKDVQFDENGKPYCVCNSGYNGKNCELSDKSNCHNNGTIEITDKSTDPWKWRCVCKNGFEGMFCSCDTSLKNNCKTDICKGLTKIYCDDTCDPSNSDNTHCGNSCYKLGQSDKCPEDAILKSNNCGGCGDEGYYHCSETGNGLSFSCIKQCKDPDLSALKSCNSIPGKMYNCNDTTNYKWSCVDQDLSSCDTKIRDNMNCLDENGKRLDPVQINYRNKDGNTVCAWICPGTILPKIYIQNMYDEQDIPTVDGGTKNIYFYGNTPLYPVVDNDICVDGSRNPVRMINDYEKSIYDNITDYYGNIFTKDGKKFYKPYSKNQSGIIYYDSPYGINHPEYSYKNVYCFKTPLCNIDGGYVDQKCVDLGGNTTSCKSLSDTNIKTRLDKYDCVCNNGYSGKNCEIYGDIRDSGVYGIVIGSGNLYIVPDTNNSLDNNSYPITLKEGANTLLKYDKNSNTIMIVKSDDSSYLYYLGYRNKVLILKTTNDNETNGWVLTDHFCWNKYPYGIYGYENGGIKFVSPNSNNGIGLIMVSI